MTHARKPTILIIDNDEGIQRAIAARLENIGYICLSASSGTQGLSEFRDQNVDLVITDLNMPAGNGVTLIKTIRETSTVPVIIVTGFKQEYQRDLRMLEDVSILLKPFNSSELVDLVEAELALHGHPIQP